MVLFLRALAAVVIVTALGSLLAKRDPAMAIANIAIAMNLLNSARIHELESRDGQS